MKEEVSHLHHDHSHFESTAAFNSLEVSSVHLPVVFTAPGGNCPTCVVSTSEGDYDPESDRIVSNVARQANGTASICKVLEKRCCVEYGMTATHSFTDDQMILVADTVICAWLVRVLATLCQSPPVQHSLLLRSCVSYRTS